MTGLVEGMCKKEISVKYETAEVKHTEADNGT